MNDFLKKYFSGYAMEYGTCLGLAWIAVFALYVGGLRTMNPLLLLIAILAWACLPVLAFMLAHRFKLQLPKESSLGFGRAYLWCMVTLVYASLLTGAAEWFYFAQMDKGVLFAQLRSFFEDSRVNYVGMGLTQAEMVAMIDSVQGLTPRELVLSLLNQNVFLSLFLAFPMAFFARKSKHAADGSQRPR